MAIRDTNTAEEFPYIFMIEQSIFQSRIFNQADNPKYSLSLAWLYYKIEADGTMVFSSEHPESYNNDDFYVDAVVHLMDGDSTHSDTLTAQQLSVKHIIQEHTGKTLEVV